MTITASADPTSTTLPEVDVAIAALQRGAERLGTLDLHARQDLLARSTDGVAAHAQQWVELAWQAKQIPAGSDARAEDVMTGPISTLRYLHLMRHTLIDLERTGRPKLPGKPYQRGGQWRIPIFPTSHLLDAVLFRPLRAEVWLSPDVKESDWFGDNLQVAAGTSNAPAQVGLVLGAGNVSSIPITDALTKIFQHGQAVLLKMNPVNQYLGPVFERIFAPLVENDLLRIVYGDAEVGGHAIEHAAVEAIHITGSDRTHDAIVWGATEEEQDRRRQANEPCLTKPITSELGNVSPWIIVPGDYSDRELTFQAENIAASITHNASFNCIATKMLITWDKWPQRTQLLDRLESILTATPKRHAYYPGAAERYARFAGESSETNDGCLPWKLLRGTNPEVAPYLFEEESFVCVCAETTIDAADEQQFLTRAVDFANERLWGTLAAAVTVPEALRKDASGQLDLAVGTLRYGTIGVNQWPGVAFALMSPPWGGFPCASLADVQSGVGQVHNTYLIDRAEKTVLTSPLTIWPKPMWFSTHRRPEALAWRLLELYKRPSIWKLPAVMVNAVRG